MRNKRRLEKVVEWAARWHEYQAWLDKYGRDGLAIYRAFAEVHYSSPKTQIALTGFTLP